MNNSQAQGANPQAQEQVVPSLGDMLGGEMLAPEQQEQQGGVPQVDPAGFPINPNISPEGEPNKEPAGEQKPEEEKPTDTPLEGVEAEYSFLAGDGAGLSQEDLTTRNQVLGHFGASAMSKTGDLVDTAGNVVLRKADLDKFIDTGEVPTDEKGNQIKADGSIFRPAEDLQPRFIDATREIFEAEIPMTMLDAEGKPKVYADSVEGVAEYTKDVYNQAQINSVSEFLNSNPKVKDFFFHIANGNDAESYELKPVDYGSIDLNTLEKADKLNLIKTSLEKQKVQNAKSLMTAYELANDELINTTAADALITLNNLTQADTAKREADYLAQVEAQKQEDAKYWNEVKSAVQAGAIKNIKIPDAEKEGFFKYLAVPTNSKGLSQAQLDAEAEDLETALMIDYLRYKKGNIDDLINLRAKTSKVDAIRQRMKAVPNPRIVNNKTPDASQGNQNPEINLGSLLNAEYRQ